MPQAATFHHGLAADAANTGRRVPLQLLFVATTLSALGGALAAVLLERIVVAGELTHGIPIASVHLAAPPPADTSVPDASEVFAGHDGVVEEPVPTF